MTASETFIKLPAHTLYLKAVRPKLRYKQDVVKNSIEQYKKVEYESMNVGLQHDVNSAVLTNYQVHYSDFDENSQAIQILNEGDPQAGLVCDFKTFSIDWILLC